MVRVLAFLLLVTNIFSQEGGASNSSAEQDTMSLDSTIPSTAPVAVVEGFKVALREGRIPGRKKRYSKMRLSAVDAKAQQKLSQKVDLYWTLQAVILFRWKPANPTMKIRIRYLLPGPQ